MYKHFFVCLLLLHLSFQIVAQCPIRNVSLSSQSDVDEYVNNYPNCDTIKGNLSITNSHSSDLDLSGLNNIKTIEGRLFIQRNSKLTSLNGLQNIETVKEYIWISDNRSLLSLNGFKKITNVGEHLQIIENKSLVSLSGLTNLTKVGGHLIIRENESLINLDGLQNLETIGDELVIDNNNQIVNLDELSNLKKVGGLVLVENSNLTNINSLVNINDTIARITIRENSNLLNLEALKNITYVTGILHIEECENLTALKGLDNITGVEDYLLIKDNNRLNSIEALNKIRFVGGQMSINSNDELRYLNGVDNITQISGGLRISGNRVLENLDPLKNLLNFSGNLSISNNSKIQNLASLSNIKKVSGYVFIVGNSNLLSLDGLQNITEVDEYMFIKSRNLKNVDELQNLTSVGKYIKLEGNNNLIDLNGLKNLRFLGTDLEVRYNDKLSDITGLSGITSINGELTIEHNPLLDMCNTDNICDFLLRNFDSSDKYLITENKDGCNFALQILDDCGEASRVNAFLFYDINQNKVKEVNEPLMPLGSISIDPIGTTVFPNPFKGFFEHILLPGVYTFKLNQFPGWSLSTDSIQYTLNLEKGIFAQIEFGMYPSELISDVHTSVNSPNNRCNDTIPFHISTQNTGTTVTDGTLWFQVDTLISTIEYVEEPDTIIQPKTYGWFFNDVPPGKQITKQIDVVIPGPPNFEIGNNLNYQSYCEYVDTNGTHTTSKFNYEAIVRCSYDPNDKLVNPQHPCNYTLFDVLLSYTIRFQNTGNDFAENVVIRDTLDKNLDLSTFTLMGSSHPNVLSTSLIEENRLVTFEFNAINLPDSTKNAKASQGFVSFMIQPKDGLAENTLIENTSGIYFDYNPPIITNTVKNILVNEIPNYTIYTWCRDADNDGLGSALHMIESCEQPEDYVSDCTDMDDVVSIMNYELTSKVSIYPNPSSGSFQIALDEESFKNATFNVFNSAGIEVIPPNQINRTNQFYNYKHLPNGVYYVNIVIDDSMVIQKKLLILK